MFGQAQNDGRDQVGSFWLVLLYEAAELLQVKPTGSRDERLSPPGRVKHGYREGVEVKEPADVCIQARTRRQQFASEGATPDLQSTTTNTVLNLRKG